MTETFPPLRLRRNEERRLRAGHLWVYSNEVDTDATPLKSFEPGTAVEIQAHNGKALGTGYVNPHSLICARLVSRDPRHPLAPSLLVHRLNVALALRQRLFPQPYYRLAYGEADGLPGLVVDRYGDFCVVQITTAGMERLREAIIAALDKVVKPRAILLRNDSPIRELEHLPRYVEGEGIPDRAEVMEGPGRFLVAPRSGQKTGWFYDQADNRQRLHRYVKGARVLDVFAYVGAWGIQSLLHGAESAVCVDGSETALALARENAVLNGVETRLRTVHGDAFEVLRGLREAREQFDVVVVDPPAFVKRRKDGREGALAYRRVFEGVMQLLTRDGLLVACSCSHHFDRDQLVHTVLAGSRHLDRTASVLEFGQQAVDHPVHPAIPETAYLKAVYARILPA